MISQGGIATFTGFFQVRTGKKILTKMFGPGHKFNFAVLFPESVNICSDKLFIGTSVSLCLTK